MVQKPATWYRTERAPISNFLQVVLLILHVDRFQPGVDGFPLLVIHPDGTLFIFESELVLSFVSLFEIASMYNGIEARRHAGNVSRNLNPAPRPGRWKYDFPACILSVQNLIVL
jgi:hypothetical protein